MRDLQMQPDSILFSFIGLCCLENGIIVNELMERGRVLLLGLFGIMQHDYHRDLLLLFITLISALCYRTLQSCK